MLDKPIFHLGGAWWLCHDRLQWVLSVADNPPITPQEGVLSTAPERLRAVAFIASTRAVLLRVAKEKGIPLTTKTNAALDDLPATFNEWLRLRDRPDRSG